MGLHVRGNPIFSQISMIKQFFHKFLQQWWANWATTIRTVTDVNDNNCKHFYLKYVHWSQLLSTGRMDTLGHVQWSRRQKWEQSGVTSICNYLTLHKLLSVFALKDGRWCAMSMNVVKRMYLHSLCICNYTYGVLLLMDIFIYLIFYFWQRCWQYDSV